MDLSACTAEEPCLTHIVSIFSGTWFAPWTGLGPGGSAGIRIANTSNSHSSSEGWNEGSSWCSRLTCRRRLVLKARL